MVCVSMVFRPSVTASSGLEVETVDRIGFGWVGAKRSEILDARPPTESTPPPNIDRSLRSGTKASPAFCDDWLPKRPR